MVRLQLPHIFTLVFALSLIILMAAAVGTTQAQTLVYHLEHEWAKIWVNQDGTIDLLYDILIMCDAGTLHWVEIGQPTGDFYVGPAYDENNNNLPASDTSEGDHYKVRVDVEDLNAGDEVRFNLTTNVGGMLWEDSQNPGNVGMQFTPSWFPVSIGNLRLLIVLPAGVNATNLKTSVDWDNIGVEDGNLTVYWERQDLVPNQQFTFGVSFPKEFVQEYQAQPNFFQAYGLWIAVLVIVGVVVILVGVVAFRKREYLRPILSVETLGIRRGLTAVEASYLLDVAPKMIVTEILYSLLSKRVVWATATKPSVKLRVLKPIQGAKEERLQQPPLRYYEIDFVNAIKEDGLLDETRLAETVLFLRHSVEEKLRGYCRRDTIDYYKKVVAKAWEQVEQAGTPALASKAYDEQLLWLLLDPQQGSRTQKAFENRVFEPAPLWFWYWYGYQHYSRKPTYQPNLDTPAQSQQPPTIPGADFANNIATAVENTSNSIVVNLEKFANAILPPPPSKQTSRQPARKGASCVCACAACACACACVSCACACAGGGAG